MFFSKSACYFSLPALLTPNSENICPNRCGISSHLFSGDNGRFIVDDPRNRLVATWLGEGAVIRDVMVCLGQQLLDVDVVHHGHVTCRQVKQGCISGFFSFFLSFFVVEKKTRNEHAVAAYWTEIIIRALQVLVNSLWIQTNSWNRTSDNF